MKIMLFAAKIAVLCVIVLLIVIINLTTHMTFMQSETVILDEKDGYIVFYATSEQLYSLNSRIIIETAQQTYENVEIAEISEIEFYIGNNQVIMYRTNLLTTDCAGATAVIRQPFETLLDYVVNRNTYDISYTAYKR